MEISKDDLSWAAAQGLLSDEQAEQLWQALAERTGNSESAVDHRPRFDLPHVAYYFGALIVIGAMSWFMTLAWEEFGGAGIFIISCVYALCFVLAGHTLWYRQNLRIPGGLLITIAVCLTPLAIYGLQRWTGIWIQDDPGTYPNYHIWVKGSWLLMELGTIAAGLIALRFFRFPFLIAPVAFTLWYMSMDLTPLLFGQITFTWEQRLLVSMWFGIAVLIVAYWVDLRSRRSQEDYAFWLYLFGLLSFWTGLSLSNTDSEFQWFLYCLINIGLISLSLLLHRRLFIIFGALGVFGYLSHLASIVFRDSLLFPFALSAIGVAIIWFGVFYQRHQRRLEQIVDDQMPDWLSRVIPQRR